MPLAPVLTSSPDPLKVTVNSFGPGLITRTGFFRNQNPVFVKLFDVATNDLFKVQTTVIIISSLELALLAYHTYKSHAVQFITLRTPNLILTAKASSLLLITHGGRIF